MPKEDYVVIKRIGQGAQGSVYEVKHTITNEVLAMKKIDVSHLSEKEKQSALQEVRVLATLQQHPHPNVMGYKESFVDSGDAMLCLVLEWSSEGSLEDRFDRDKDVGHNNIAGPSTSSAASVQPPPPPPLTENEVWRVFLSVVLALDHVHGLRILHRDVKMANVFLHSHRNTYASAVQVPSTRETSSSNGGGFAIANDKGPVPRSKRKTLIDRVQLGDFGVSTILKDRSNALTLVGTPYYFSPELCMGKAYSSKSDVWSLGILLFTMLHNRMPFEANNYGALILRIVQQSSIVIPSHATANGSAAGGSGEGYSPILSKLCAWTLQKKEVARPTARDLICHPACLAKALDLELTIPQDVLQNQAVMGAMLTRAGRLRIPPNPSYISTAPMNEQQLVQDAGSRPKTSVATRANAIPLRKANILNEQANEETNKKGGWVRSTKPSAGVGVVEQAPPHRVTSPKRMKPPSLQSDQVKNQDSTSARASGPGMYKKERPRGGCGGASVYYIPDNHESNKNDRRPIVVVAAQSDPSTPLTIRTVKHRPGHSHAEKEHHPAVEPTRPSKQPIRTTKGDIDSVRELPDTVGGNGNENSKRHKGPTNSPEYESQAITLAKRNTTPTSAKNTSESPSFYAEAVAQSFAGIMPPTASHRIEALIREHDSRYASANLNSYSSNNNANEEQTSDENIALNFSGSGGYERIRFSTPRDLSRYLSQQQIELQENEGDAAVSQSEDPTNADESLTTHTYRPGAYYDEQDPYEDVPLTTSEEVVEEILDGETDSDIETSAAVTWRVGNEEGTASGDMIATANSHARPVSANRTSKNSEKPTETLGKANVRHGGGSLPPRPSSATYKQAPLSARQQLVNTTTMNSTASSVASHDNIPIPIAELTGGKRSFGIGQLSSGAVVSRKTAHSNPSTVQQPKKASLADELILTTDPNTKRVGSSGSDPMRRKDTCVDINCTNASVTTTTTTVDDSERLSDMIQSVELEGAAIAGALIFKKVSDAVRASSQGGGPLLSALGKDSAKVFLSGLGIRDEKKQALLMHLAFRLLFLQGQLHRIQNE